MLNLLYHWFRPALLNFGHEIEPVRLQTQPAFLFGEALGTGFAAQSELLERASRKRAIAWREVTIRPPIFVYSSRVPWIPRSAQR